MNKISARLTSSVAAMLAATTSFAEPTIQELEKRMLAMESTLQTILLELEKQNARRGEPPYAQTAEGNEVQSSTSFGYQMGALYLDVFTMTLSEEEGNAMRNDPTKLPDGPIGAPSGSVIIPAVSPFDFGDFKEEPTLSGFADADALVSVQWFGVVEVQEAGPHTISIQLKKGPTSIGACRSVLRFSGTVVADALGDYDYEYSEQVDIGQSTQELVPGMYDFSLWTTCAGRRENAMKSGATDIAVAAPSERAPKPILPERYGIQP